MEDLGLGFVFGFFKSSPKERGYFPLDFRKSGGEREKERDIDVTEMHRLAASHTRSVL